MSLSKQEALRIKDELIKWIKDTMESTGGKKAVLGISGGKDSSVVAALCVQALGKENVFGVLMPDGKQYDIDYSYDLCDFLDIKYKEVSIKPMTDAFIDTLNDLKGDFIDDVSKQTLLNLSPRIRMTLLYGISQSIDGSRVINTSNLSEDWVGYATVYGDTAGAFSPLGMMTTEEVIEVGRLLNLPEKFLEKAPADGLTGKTDEDILGFSYNELNEYIREGIVESNLKSKIDRMHEISSFKLQPIPMYNPGLLIKAKDETNIYK